MRAIFLLLILSFSLVSNLASADLSELQLKLQQKYDDIDRKSPETKEGLSDAERKKLLKDVMEHPVAKLSRVKDFDPDKLGTGFCFGRAMTAHLLARKMGLPRKAIVKLFIAGDMMSGNERWRFHVSTMVRGDNGKYYSIDPVIVKEGFPDPLLPADWMKHTKASFDKNSKSKFYVTDPDAVMVDMTEVPALVKKETGDRIIEVTFDPEKKVGFEEQKVFGDTGELKAYQMDEEAREKYFINRSERKAGGDFDFLKLPVKILYENETKDVNFDYHNYFKELFDTF